MSARKPVRFRSADDLVEGRGSRGPKPRGWRSRFHDSFDASMESECWNWSGYISNTGYGTLSIANVHYLAHRLSYVIANGSIDPDLVVMHSCDNRRCVNPAHLSLGTPRDNTIDAITKGRFQKGQRNGMAKLSEQQVADVKLAWASGAVSMKQMAEQYGVWVPCIWRILNGTRWRHTQ